MKAEKKWGLFRIALTALFLFAIWLLFTVSRGAYAISTGIIASLGMAVLSYDVFIEKFEAGRRSVIPRPLPGMRFLFRLVLVMYASSVHVMRAVISGRMNPRVTHFRSPLHSDLARVVMAESITFTPGTITLELDDDHYIVHWLFSTTRHSALAGGIIKGGLERDIGRIWS
ncbi:cation:proton antiporter [Spirochaetia bacterium]|nr:cation:proton antiporter [Spirochaetia bacterium]